MSLYSDFVTEIGRESILEIPNEGFATYKIFPERGECYIGDIYVIPEKRKSDLASTMADSIAQIARAKGCKYLTGSVITSGKTANTSLKVLLSYGFRLLRSENDMIWFVKEL